MTDRFRVWCLCFQILCVGLAPGLSTGRTNSQTGQVAPAARNEDGDEVLLTVTVTDKDGHPVAAIAQSSFTIEVGKATQEITGFAKETRPMSIGFLIDMSASLATRRGSWGGFVREISLRLVDSVGGGEYFLVAFAHGPKLVTDWTSDRVSVDKGFTELSRMPVSGPTALYDACYEAIEKVKTRRNRRQVLVLVTDGEDTASGHSLETVRRLLQRSEVMVYALALKHSHPIGLGGDGEEGLRTLASISGGKVFPFDDAAKALAAFQLLALELDSQYSVRFRPEPSLRDGKWHTIKVEISPMIESGDTSSQGKPRKLVARTRAGYYPATSPAAK